MVCISRTLMSATGVIKHTWRIIAPLAIRRIKWSRASSSTRVTSITVFTQPKGSRLLECQRNYRNPTALKKWNRAHEEKKPSIVSLEFLSQLYREITCQNNCDAIFCNIDVFLFSVNLVRKSFKYTIFFFLMVKCRLQCCGKKTNETFSLE